MVSVWMARRLTSCSVLARGSSVEDRFAGIRPLERGGGRGRVAGFSMTTSGRFVGVGVGEIHPEHWLAEYTTELLNVLHVLALLVELEPKQAKLREAICAGPTRDYGR